MTLRASVLPLLCLAATSLAQGGESSPIERRPGHCLFVSDNESNVQSLNPSQAQAGCDAFPNCTASYPFLAFDQSSNWPYGSLGDRVQSGMEADACFRPGVAVCETNTLVAYSMAHFFHGDLLRPLSSAGMGHAEFWVNYEGKKKTHRPCKVAHSADFAAPAAHKCIGVRKWLCVCTNSTDLLSENANPVPYFATKPPTVSPTLAPTLAPVTDAPTTPLPENGTTLAPTLAPTLTPTLSPTESPTTSPTSSPTASPTPPPTPPTTSPTQSPTSSPTTSPTQSPTSSPTTSPTPPPTPPTTSPTQSPTSSPTTSPTPPPTPPTTSPTQSPTSSPTPLPEESEGVESAELDPGDTYAFQLLDSLVDRSTWSDCNKTDVDDVCEICYESTEFVGVDCEIHEEEARRIRRRQLERSLQTRQKRVVALRFRNLGISAELPVAALQAFAWVIHFDLSSNGSEPNPNDFTLPENATCVDLPRCFEPGVVCHFHPHELCIPEGVETLPPILSDPEMGALSGDGSGEINQTTIIGGTLASLLFVVGGVAFLLYRRRSRNDDGAAGANGKNQLRRRSSSAFRDFFRSAAAKDGPPPGYSAHYFDSQAGHPPASATNGQSEALADASGPNRHRSSSGGSGMARAAIDRTKQILSSHFGVHTDPVSTDGTTVAAASSPAATIGSTKPLEFGAKKGVKSVRFVEEAEEDLRRGRFSYKNPLVDDLDPNETMVSINVNADEALPRAFFPRSQSPPVRDV